MPIKHFHAVVKLARWGDGLGFRIPQEAIDQLRLKAGETVNVTIAGATVTVSRTTTRKRWTEKELLHGVTPALCGPELVVDRRGKEPF